MAEEYSLKKIIEEEYKKCAGDPKYFIRKYVLIQHPKRGKINFTTYPFQNEVLDKFTTHSRNIIVKNRQMGLSTLSAAYGLWLMTFRQDSFVLVIATKQDVAKNIINKVRFAHSLLPSWLKLKCTEDNKLGQTYMNGSWIKAITTSGEDSGRSEGVTLLIVDEAAFIKQMDELWGGLQPTLSTGGDVIVLSTPNGMGNWFHKTYQNASELKNTFNAITLHWTMHPERDQEWRDAQELELGPRLAAQECFDGDTRIFTENGYKKIKNINLNDNVLTHTGNFKKVIKLYKKKSNKLYEINSFLNKNKSYVTKNHPFLYKNKYLEIENINNNTLLPIISNNINYKKNIKHIDLYDIIKPKHFKKKLTNDNKSFYINDRKHKTIHNRFIDIDYDFGFLLGIYVAEGNASRLRLYISHHQKEKDTWVSDITKIINNKFGLNNFKYRIGPTGTNGADLIVSSEILCNTLKYFIDGNYSYDKHLSEFAYENGNLDFFKGYIDGLFLGDGLISTDKYSKRIGITSLEAIYDIKFILHLMGINNISFNIQKTDNRTIYILNILNSKNIILNENKISNILIDDLIQTRYKNEYNTNDKYTLSKLNKNKIKNEIDVYNLEIEDDNTYTTEHFIVHNCDGDWITSGNTVVSGEILQWYKETHVMEPIERTGIDRNIWIWEYPDSSKSYIVSADTGRGDSDDFSAFEILELETMTQVAEYQGMLGTKDFGNLLVEYAVKYNDALLVIENNSIGWATIQAVMDRNYSNLFYSTNNLKYVDPNDSIKLKQKVVPGLTTSSVTRPLMISKMDEYYRGRNIVVRSSRLISQQFTFIWVSNKPQASHGYNDDLVLSHAFALWVRDTALKLRVQGIEMSKTMIDNFSRDTSTNIVTSNTITYNPYQMDIGNNESEDLSKWL